MTQTNQMKAVISDLRKLPQQTFMLKICDNGKGIANLTLCGQEYHSRLPWANIGSA